MKKHKITSLWNHLYILSDDKIEVGDYLVVTDGWIVLLEAAQIINKVLKCTETHRAHIGTDVDIYVPVMFSKKIIATTDKSLGLPLIPESVVRQYTRHPVEEVLVQYKVLGSSWEDVEFHLDTMMTTEENSSKWVQISDVETSWTKDEIKWFIMTEVINYIDIDKHSPTAVITHLMSRLGTLHHNYTQYVEDQKADRLLNEWKNEGISS